MKRFLLLLALIATTMASFAQFSDTAQLNAYVKDTIKDRRPEKVTAAQIQKAFLGTSKFITGVDSLRKSNDTLYYRRFGVWKFIPGFTSGGGAITEQAIVDALKYRAGVSFSFPSNDHNPEFMVFASAILRITNTYVHGTPITWGILTEADGHGSSFFNGVQGNVSQELEVLFPSVKRAFFSIAGPDESYAAQCLNIGPSVQLSKAIFRVYRPKTVGVRLVGNGSGGWTVNGDASLFDITSFSTADGGTSFNVTANDLFGIYDKMIIQYQGPNGYGISRLFSGLGAYNARFVIEKPAGAGFLNTNPTTSDMVVIQGGTSVEPINMNMWSGSNNPFMSGGLFNWWVYGMFEAWMVGSARSNSEIYLKWQNYPSATSYKLYRATIADFSDQVLINSANVNSYLDNGRAANTLYYYKLKAVVSGVDTDVTTWSNKTLP